MSTSIDERVSGLPADLEEGNSGNEDKTSTAQIVIPKDRTESAETTAREIALNALIQQNPRVALYRQQDPTFRDDDVKFWADVILRAHPIIQDGASASAPTATVTDHSPASPVKAEEATRPLFAGASVIRAAIMDVIDVTEWRLYEGRDNGRYVREDVATAERGAFADAVEKRIRELQVPPFSLGTKLENYCPRHIRERLPAPTATVCADCMAEREEKK